MVSSESVKLLNVVMPSDNAPSNNTLLVMLFDPCIGLLGFMSYYIMIHDLTNIFLIISILIGVVLNLCLPISYINTKLISYFIIFLSNCRYFNTSYILI